MSLSSGPTDATPPAAAAFDVPTAGVPTYVLASVPRALADATVACPAAGRGAAGAAGLAADAAAAGVGAAAAEVAGSPSRAVTSASFNAGNPLRLRRACSAATTDRLHFFPAATMDATSGLIAWLELLAAAGGGGAAAGAGGGAL